MEGRNYRVVSCEGGDQFGKADAILTFAKKFTERGVSITFSSFPMYASPFGTVIRKFLRNGLEDFKFEPEKELKTKMALYALDRLQFLDVVLSNPEYKKTLILLDRSSFSNAVTIAYGITHIENLKKKDIEDLTNYAFWLDGLMMRKLGLKKCVIQMVSSSEVWKNVRKEEQDINENLEVQKATDKMYDIYRERVGKGWGRIVTKTNDGWEDREEIFNRIYTFVVSRLGEFNLEVFPKKYTINIQEVLQNSYPGTNVAHSDVKTYWKALNDNDKDTMHEYGMKIGEEIGLSCKEFRLNDEEVRKAFSKILKKDPAIFLVLERYLGDNFATKISEAVAKW